ncbi:HAMP domain-containing sensor histidine kinase [Paenibacillus sp. ACRRY]|uniref:sensor histidine kinase n=1 Tax=Paenibacillus sp. ACRRY TaxID=2918208 RepID=UPI001EF5E057|nr:HAMP domain-containing sensor histidine kinase [Paenibacillus sp. ACRRY]MCG7381734.1 HAMP domain-containing histidine kinase [Paenibacillus sp. ACRRY]
MIKHVRKLVREKSIQVNILIRIIITLFISININNVFISVSIKIGKSMDTDWYLHLFPYINTPLFIVNFIIIFLILTRRIVKDLVKLEHGLEIIAKGDLDYRVTLDRQDELGKVAKNINRMAEQLERQIAKERKIEQSKMEMITGLSHDLRTPLTSIIGYIQLLKTESYRDQDEYTRFIQNTYNKAIHLRKLLDDLFEYTRITSVDDTQLKRKNIALDQLLEQMVFEFEPLAQENGVRIVKEIHPHPISVYVDSDKIARAIDNLMMNAIKYSVKPGIVYVRLENNGSNTSIEIENEGAPLAEEQVSKLFDRFYKVDYSRTSEGIQAGSGLGLSIARNIAELHQGSLTLHHTNGVFLFRMTLPILN